MNSKTIAHEWEINYKVKITLTSPDCKPLVDPESECSDSDAVDEIAEEIESLVRAYLKDVVGSETLLEVKITSESPSA